MTGEAGAFTLDEEEEDLIMSLPTDPAKATATAPSPSVPSTPPAPDLDLTALLISADPEPTDVLPAASAPDDTVAATEPPVALLADISMATPEPAEPPTSLSPAVSGSLLSTEGNLSAESNLRKSLSAREQPKDCVDSSLGLHNLADTLARLRDNQEEISDTEMKLQALLKRQGALMAAERLLEQQKLLDVLGLELGFYKGRPVAAMLIYRCCLQWKCFALDQAPILDLIVECLVRQTNEDEINARHSEDPEATNGATTEMAYWLAVNFTLLALVDKQVPGRVLAEPRTAAAAAAQKIGELQKRMAGSLNAFGKNLMRRVRPAEGQAAVAAAPAVPPARQGSGMSASGDEDLVMVPADSGGSITVGGPSPGQAFRHNLDLLVQKCYGQVRDALKRHLSSLLPPCVQAPPQVKADNFTLLSDDEEEAEAGSRSYGGSITGEERLALLRPWCELVGVLTQHLQLLREAHVPRIVIKCLFKQVFGFVNSQLFNQLLLRPECCSVSNARYMAAGLQRLDTWINGADGEEDLRVLSEDLRHVRQAAHFLIRASKSTLALEDITAMCPSLNMQQLYRLCTTFWDDTPTTPTAPTASAAPAPATVAPDGEDDGLGQNGAQPQPQQPPSPLFAPARLDNNVSGEVLEEMKRHNVSNNGGLIVTFLLDEDPQALIAPQGTTAPELLRLVDDTHLYLPLPVPAQLSTEDCPPEVFAFLTADLRPVAASAPSS